MDAFLDGGRAPSTTSLRAFSFPTCGERPKQTTPSPQRTDRLRRANQSKDYAPKKQQRSFGMSTRAVVLLSGLCASMVTLSSAWRGFGQASTQTADVHLAEGIQLMSAGRLPEAVKAFNAAKQNAPRDARLYFYCGMALAQAGQPQDAASELLEAVHLAPEQLDYRIFQAHVFQQLMQTAAAENTLAAFKSDSSLRQLDPAWLRLLADVYYRLGKTEESLRVLNRWAELDPKDARIDLYRGQVYELKGQPDEALRFFERSIAESEQNPLAYFEVGNIHYSKNQLVAARQALLKALSQDKDNPEYRSKLALVYLAMKDPDAAIECLRNVESAGDRMPTIYYVLGHAYRIKGEQVRSAEFLSRFQQVTQANRDQQERTLEAQRPIAQGERQLDQGHTDEARALFHKALQVDPNQWQPNAYLAEMDLDSGDLAGAYPHLQKLEQLDPDSTIGNFLMARYWFKKKDYEQARRYAEKAKLSRPDNSELRSLLGNIYLELGERLKAREEYEAAVHLAPDRADFREQLQKLQASTPRR